jgi:Mg/Co/Ni transporter MgtE
LVALGFAFFSTQPLTNSLIAEVSDKEVRGFYYGVTFLTRDGLGIIPLILMGSITISFGIGAAMYVSLLFAVLALVSTFFISEGLSKNK